MTTAVQHRIDQANGGALALAEAEKLKGRPYVYGGWPLGTNGTDCSGTWDWAYQQIGINIGRTTFVQYKEFQIKKGSKLEPGDLLFIEGSDPGPNGEPGHVMGFVKDGEVFQAPYTGETINFYPYDTTQYAYVTRPAMSLPIHIPAPSSLILSSNHLVGISEQETGTAISNKWVIYNWDGSKFIPDNPNAGATRCLYVNTAWKEVNPTKGTSGE